MSANSRPEPTKPGIIKRIVGVIRDYPSQFWIVVFGTFIDRLGGSMLWPFFTLFITRKFNIGMTQAGLLLFVFSITGMVGSTIGGALTDRFGRKVMILFSLTMSATSAILMGVIDQLSLFVAATVLVGLLADTGGPAREALIADLLPEEKRADGFGILRVAFNLSVAIGPLIGGLLAVYNYMYIFISDAVMSLITAGIILVVLKETWKPQEREEQKPETLAQTFRGYGRVMRDRAFVFYMLASMLMVLVYINMNTTLAPYLRNVHGVNEQGFSYILSLNAIMVVLFQFPITRWVTRYRPLMVMTFGTLLYAVGFAMYGFVSWYPFFLVAMVIITIGEMFVSPVGQAIATRLAPENMRGRYMAAFGFTWGIPFMIGPIAAGMVLDYLNPNLLWYMAGIIGVFAALAYYALQGMSDKAGYAVVDQRLQIMERLEAGKISAEAAQRMLAEVAESSLGRLSPPAPATERRHMIIQVRDPSSGKTKVDLRLPMGLVNTALYAGAPMAAALLPYDSEPLRDLLAHSEEQDGAQQIVTDNNHLEVEVKVE
jgi:predicted MFS family arabinose efflux permease